MDNYIRALYLGFLFPPLLLSCATTPDTWSDADGPIVPLRPDCTREESAPLDVDAFMDDPSIYVGKCVHARGMIAFRRFYSDLQSLYEPVTSEVYHAPRMIGIYGSTSVGWPNLWGMRDHVDIVAFAYTCADWGRYAQAGIERRREEAIARGEQPPLEMIFMAGECHYYDIPILFVSDGKILPNQPVRLTGLGAAAEHGDLVEVEEIWEHYNELSHIVSTVISFSRKRDEDGLIAALSNLGERGDGIGRSVARSDAQRIMAEGSPYSFLFGRTTQPAIKYFRIADGAWQEPGDYIAYGCVCKSEDCEDTWPISTIDTDTYNGWPYLCVGVEREDGGQWIYIRT